MKHLKRLGRFLLASSLLAGALQGNTARAQSGVWTNPNGGSWADPVNWRGGNIAQGADNSADFSTLSLAADATVTLDGAQAVGNLIFGDQASAHNWILNTGSGDPLVLDGSANAPTITVNNQTATIGLTLAGTLGMTKNGSGTLVLVQTNGYTGGTTNNAGTLRLLGTLNTYKNSPLAVNSGYVESSATLNLCVIQSGSANSVDLTGAGTIRLVGTTNSSSSPDVCFGPDHNGTSYYGATANMGTLDLGAGQRFIYAFSSHNSVSKYRNKEDARINGNIIGAGGITYIAQNNFANMECPLVLAGANTFAGEVEIQRGSIYLFNAQALVQNNKLLLDPAAGNSARLFLYGNAAAVTDLESSGAGTTVIANGNVHNSVAAIPAATLTVNQISSTTFSGALMDALLEYDAGTYTSGALSLVKNGPGTLTLSGASTYSGSTVVNAGKLVIPSVQTGGGACALADGAALGINVIGANTLPMSALTLGNSAGTTLEIAFSSSPSSSVAAVTAANLTVNGAANAVTLKVDINGGVTVGQFPLISYSGAIGGTGFSAFKLAPLSANLTAELVNNTLNHSIDLSVTAVALPEWSGALGSEWSANKLASPKNWVLITGGTTPADYMPGNPVLFNDVATGTTVDVSVADLSPASVTFNNDTKDYTLTGSKAIAGATGLVKTGNGILAIANSNSFTGPVTISGGTVIINSENNLGAVPAVPTPGSIVLNDATLSAEGTATLSTNRGLALGPTGGTGYGTLDVASGAVLTIDGSVANNGTSVDSLKKTGAGHLVLAGTNTYSGGTSNNSGTLTFLQNQSFARGSALGIAANAVVESAGTLNLIVDATGAVSDVTGGGLLRLTSTNSSTNSPDLYFGPNHSGTSDWGAQLATALDLGNAQRIVFAKSGHNGVGQYGLLNADCEFNGPISGAGGLTFIAQMNWPGSMEVGIALNASNSFTGPVELQRGSIYLGNANAFPAGDVLRFNVADGNNGRFFLYGNNATVSDLSSTNVGTALIAAGNEALDKVGPATLTVVQNNDATFNGTLTDLQPEYRRQRWHPHPGFEFC